MSRVLPLEERKEFYTKHARCTPPERARANPRKRASHGRKSSDYESEKRGGNHCPEKRPPVGELTEEKSPTSLSERAERVINAETL